MTHSTSVPYPNKVWYFNIVAFLLIVLGIKVLVGFTVDFMDATSLWYFVLASGGIIALLVSTLTGMNILYEEYNRVPESAQNHGKGVKYLVGFTFIGYIFFVFLFALYMEHTDIILYFIEVYSILAYSLTLVFVTLIVAYISIYHIWG